MDMKELVISFIVTGQTYAVNMCMSGLPIDLMLYSLNTRVEKLAKVS